MTLERPSFCKVNLLLNILGRRADGFHELETILQPVPVYDHLSFGVAAEGVHLTCNDPCLPTDSGNLVHRAASAFLVAADVNDGVRIHLEKKIPLAAGLGGGSGNAATTLLALNDLFGGPLAAAQLHDLAASLGSDVPFFLQSEPALATGRGEIIQPLEPFPALRGAALLLIHPGFGISTAWAYQQLVHHLSALNGAPGRGQRLVALLQNADLACAGPEFYNSLEAPALQKYPILALYQEFLRQNGATAALMSGSGSATFALARNGAAGEELKQRFRRQFGGACWTEVVSL